MKIVLSILSVLIFVGIPCFLLFRLYRLLVSTLSYTREQKTEIHELRKKLMAAQLNRLAFETEFYRRAESESPSRNDSKGGGNNGRNQKYNRRNARPAS